MFIAILFCVIAILVVAVMIKESRDIRSNAGIHFGGATSGDK